MAKIAVTDYGLDYIAVEVSELGASAKYIEFYKDGVIDKTAGNGTGYYTLSTNSQSHTFSGLTAGTSYTLSTVVYNSSWTQLQFKEYYVTQTTESGTIRVRYCDGTGSSYTAYSESITLKTPSVSGWTFAGWATSTSTSTVAYSGGDTVHAESVGQTLTLYAVYYIETTITCYYGLDAEYSNTRYRYRWRWQTGVSTYSTSNYTMNYSYLPNIQYSITTDTPARTWEPNGWRGDTRASSYEYAGGTSLTSTQIGNLPTTVYAVYSNTCSITYDSNGGSGSMGKDSDTAYYNTYGNYSTPEFSVDDCTFTPPSGKRFSHWNAKADGSGTSYDSGDTVPSNHNVIFYAIWTIGRPNDWGWSYVFYKGAAMPYTKSGNTIKVKPLTASEWLNFIDRIESFYEYLGLSIDSTYLYRATDGVSSGKNMTTTQANGARYLIDQLDPPISVPDKVSPGEKVTAEFIGGLRDSLNSIE